MATEETAPPPGAAPDWTIPQCWESYTLGEHTLWNQLFVRQSIELLPELATDALTRSDRVRHRGTQAYARNKAKIAAEANP